VSKSNKTNSSNGLMQFIIPALVGACVSAAAFAMFLAIGPDRAGAPPPPAETKASPLANMAVLNDTQRAAIEQTVEAYLIKNPQILMQMSELLEKQQTEAKTTQVRTAISENTEVIFRDKHGLETGNPKGDVTIVEFSDYNCPYCKRAFNDLTKLLGSDTKVRVVFKEFPIFGERSEGAARVAIAAKGQDKYFEMHTALLKNRGQNTEKTALGLADKLGLDMDKLKKDMASDEVAMIIKETRELGTKLGIQGTPFYLVGDRIIPGAPENLYQVFQEHVADVRKNGCEAGC
jgi:protein-disulfide isomerase